MAILGVIGGLGPMATAYFLERVTAMTDAQSDQEHIRTLLVSDPTIPDRTAYILGRSTQDPLKGILDAGRFLCSAGADVIAIPCVTAHYFHQQIEKALPARTLHVLHETAAILRDAGVRRAGVAATEGTAKSGLFRTVFAGYGIEVVGLSAGGQEKVNRLIYDQIKRGSPADPNDFFAAKEELLRGGAQAVILGCTELSLLKKEFDVGEKVLDVTDALSRAAVLACGKPLRKPYEKLL